MLEEDRSCPGSDASAAVTPIIFSQKGLETRCPRRCRPCIAELKHGLGSASEREVGQARGLSL